jgi:TRAP-type transport system periplasmic protein
LSRFTFASFTPVQELSMRVARRTFLASTAAVVAAPAVLRVAFADAPQFIFKLHHSFSSVSSVHDRFLAPWARQVEAQSGGRIRIDLFPSMGLGGTPADLFDQARYGAADIAWAVPSYTPGRFPKLEAFELPFVPSRRALVSSKALDDFARANAADEFREVRPLCFSCSDRGVLHTNQQIRTVDDVKGLKLHVPTRFAAAALRALNATAVPMPNAQLPIAVTQHVVDGCVDPWNVVPALKLNDLLKAHTEFADSSLSSTTYVLAMNQAAYDKLPRDLKSVIDANSGQTAATMAGAMWDLQAATVVDMVSQRGDPIITLLPEAVAHWRKATEPAVDSWLKDMKEHKIAGDKLLASVRTLLAKYVNEPEPQPTQAPRPAEPAQSQPPAEAKADVNATPPKVDTPSPPAAKPAPPAKPAASAAPTTPATPPKLATPSTTPAPPQPATPVAQPTPTPTPAPAPATAAATPPPPPAVAPAPPPAPVRPPAKTLDIPL